MTKYSIGDHVSWNSEAGRVDGRIIKVHHEDFDYKGHRHHASKDDPQYEILLASKTVVNRGLHLAAESINGNAAVEPSFRLR